MSKRPKRKGLSRLQKTINQLNSLAEKAADQAREIDDDYREEVWEHAASEVTKSLSISCEATMDGGVLVELTDSSGAIIKKQGFKLVDVFSKSTFGCGSEQDRQDMIAAAREVLAFAKSLKVQE